MLRNVLSNWTGFALRGVISILLTPILIHALGDFHYGLWILVMSLVDYSGILDLGIRPTLHRYVARLKGAEERAALNETIGSALAIGMATGLLVLLVTVATLPFTPALLGIHGGAVGELRWLLFLLGLNVAVLFPAGVLGAYLCGLQRFDLYNGILVITALLRAALIVATLHIGHGVLVVAAVTLATGVLTLALNWIVVRRADSAVSLDIRQANWKRIRELASFSFYVLLNSAGDYLRFYSDAVVIARVLVIALITPFSLATRLMDYFKTILAGLAGPLVPKMSEVLGQGKLEEFRRLFLRCTRLAGLLSGFIGSLLILDGKSLLHVWVGERYESSYTLLLILTVAYMINLAQLPSSVAIYALARHQLLGWWTLGEGAVNLALSIYWARSLGLMGVALGTAVPMLVTGLLFQPWYVLRLLKFSIPDYLRMAVARPVLVTGLILGFGRLLSNLFASATLWGLGATVCAQGALFVLLAYGLGLPPLEREQFSERCKQLARFGVRVAGVEESE